MMHRRLWLLGMIVLLMVTLAVFAFVLAPEALQGNLRELVRARAILPEIPPTPRTTTCVGPKTEGLSSAVIPFHPSGVSVEVTPHAPSSDAPQLMSCLTLTPSDFTVLPAQVIVFPDPILPNTTVQHPITMVDVNADVFPDLHISARDAASRDPQHLFWLFSPGTKGFSFQPVLSALPSISLETPGRVISLTKGSCDHPQCLQKDTYAFEGHAFRLVRQEITEVHDDPANALGFSPVANRRILVHTVRALQGGSLVTVSRETIQIRE